MANEALEISFEQWIQLRRQEEFLLGEILKSRGVHKSAFKRILTHTQNLIDELEKKLFK